MSAVNIYVVHIPKENLNFLILLTLQLSIPAEYQKNTL